MRKFALMLIFALGTMAMVATAASAQMGGVGSTYGGGAPGIASGAPGTVPQMVVTVEQAASWVADPNFPRWILVQPNMAFQIAEFPYVSNLFYQLPFFHQFAENYPNQGLAVMHAAMEWELLNNEQKANFFRLYPNLRFNPMAFGSPGLTNNPAVGTPGTYGNPLGSQGAAGQMASPNAGAGNFGGTQGNMAGAQGAYGGTQGNWGAQGQTHQPTYYGPYGLGAGNQTGSQEQLGGQNQLTGNQGSQQNTNQGSNQTGK